MVVLYMALSYAKKAKSNARQSGGHCFDFNRVCGLGKDGVLL